MFATHQVNCLEVVRHIQLLENHMDSPGRRAQSGVVQVNWHFVFGWNISSRVAIVQVAKWPKTDSILTYIPDLGSEWWVGVKVVLSLALMHLNCITVIGFKDTIYETSLCTIAVHQQLTTGEGVYNPLIDNHINLSLLIFLFVFKFTNNYCTIKVGRA